MTDLEHDLASAASNIHLGTGDVDMVVSRGRKRRARRQKVVGGVTALALVAGAAAMLNRDPAPTPVNLTQSLSQGDAKLHWEALSTSDGIGMSANGIGGSGPYYALSTAPGRADVNKQNPSRVLWRSDDGVDWTAAATLGNDLYLSDLAPTDGRVYAVGTAPGQAGPKHKGDLVAGWSDDNGKTFSKTALPVDWANLESKSKNIWLSDTQIASTKAGTVVTALIGATFDIPSLLPSGVTAPDGWATTATGVDILGPEKDSDVCPAGTTSDPVVMKEKAAGVGTRLADTKARRESEPRSREVESTYCYSVDGNGEGVSVSPQQSRGVVQSVTWADLGLSGDLEDAAARQPFAFFAPAGSTNFSRVDLGAAHADMAFLDADDDGFHLLTTSGNGTSVATTDFSSTDGTSWSSAAGPSGLSWVSAAGSVNGTRIIVGDSGTGAVIARRDASGAWATSSLAEALDPSVTHGKPVNALAAGVGPMGVFVAVSAPSDKDFPPTLIMSSRDGSTFETNAVNELAGHSVGTPLRISVGGQRVVVAFSGGSTPEGQAPKPQTILVATPA